MATKDVNVIVRKKRKVFIGRTPRYGTVVYSFAPIPDKDLEDHDLCRADRDTLIYYGQDVQCGTSEEFELLLEARE